LYDGTETKLYPTDREGRLIMHFKNTTPDPKDKRTIKSRGTSNATVSAALFKYLESYHIPTHFIHLLKPDEMVIHQCDVIPMKLVIWNIATGDLCKRFRVQKGMLLHCTILEYYLKDQKHRHPMINIDHACSLGFATPEEMDIIDRNARKVNAVLKSYFERRSYKLGRLTLEFGRHDDQILLIDALSLDACELWDLKADSKNPINPFDADDPGSVYEEMKKRIV